MTISFNAISKCVCEAMKLKVIITSSNNSNIRSTKESAIKYPNHKSTTTTITT